MNDEQLDHLLRAARAAEPPADPPREAMWAAIQARRRDRTRGPRVRPFPLRRLAWPAGIAAVLALGFGLGRLTVSGPGRGRLPGAAGGPSPALAGAAVQYLSSTETLLTGFRLEAETGVPEPHLLRSAHDLLLTTRLLLDSPDLKDARLRSLLQDLEVVLAQVAQLQAEPNRDDADLIVRQLDEQGVLPRLRSSIPAGPTTTIPGES
jgi:hypothetical protein